MQEQNTVSIRTPPTGIRTKYSALAATTNNERLLDAPRACVLPTYIFKKFVRVRLRTGKTRVVYLLRYTFRVLYGLGTRNENIKRNTIGVR